MAETPDHLKKTHNSRSRDQEKGQDKYCYIRRKKDVYNILQSIIPNEHDLKSGSFVKVKDKLLRLAKKRLEQGADSTL